MITKELHDLLQASAKDTEQAHLGCDNRIAELEAEVGKMVLRADFERLQNELAFCEGKLTDALYRASARMSAFNPTSPFESPRVPDYLDRRASADSGYGAAMTRQSSNEFQSSSSLRPSFNSTQQMGLQRPIDSPHSFHTPRLGRQESPASAPALPISMERPRQYAQSPYAGPEWQHEGLIEPSFARFNPSAASQSAQSYGGYSQGRSTPVLQSPSPAQRPRSQDFSMSQSPSSVPRFVPPTANERPFGFLISGFLAGGPTTMEVVPELLAKMDEQISRWIAQSGRGSWLACGPVSRIRCVGCRRSGSKPAQAPPANDPTGSVACQRCIAKKQLCVLIKDVGVAVVVPLPLADRADADFSDVGYYIKQ